MGSAVLSRCTLIADAYTLIVAGAFYPVVCSGSIVGQLEGWYGHPPEVAFESAFLDSIGCLETRF